MPIEAQNASGLVDDDTSIGAAYLSESRRTLDRALRKIAHCLNQLTDDDVHWRQFESHNSIQNIVLHLCGNVRQWIVHAVSGVPDHRDRPAEFADRQPRTGTELLGMLTEVVSAADEALAACAPQRLREAIHVQGFDTTLLAAIFDSVSHFVGHTHQIVYITRLRRGDAYKFQWTPTNVEQGAAE
jgi:uncharacterized damage-inducible protein DinB